MDPQVYFSSYTLLSVHVWLVIHRMGQRGQGDADMKFWRQRFYMQFQDDVERRIFKAGIQVGWVVGRLVVGEFRGVVERRIFNRSVGWVVVGKSVGH